MNTHERLQQYYPFDHEVLESVAAAAELQNGSSFQELADVYGVALGPERILPEGSKHPLEILSFTPRGEHDMRQAKIYYLPMANPIGPNMAMRGMRLFESDPTEKLILVGNPSSPGHAAGKLSLAGIREVVKDKSLRPCVDPVLRFAESRGLQRVSQLGFSYGADVAATASRYAALYDQEVPGGVFAEPASVVKRSVPSLAAAFGSTNKHLKHYINQTDSRPYSEIRDQETVLGLAGYSVALLRASNLAIASVLANDGFAGRVKGALEAQPNMTAAFAWGSESELASDTAMLDVADRLDTEFLPARTLSMRLEGMHHAGGDDIDLHAAIMLQGLRRPKC